MSSKAKLGYIIRPAIATHDKTVSHKTNKATMVRNTAWALPWGKPLKAQNLKTQVP